MIYNPKSANKPNAIRTLDKFILKHLGPKKIRSPKKVFQTFFGRRCFGTNLFGIRIEI